jgi:hypothetical protein
MSAQAHGRAVYSDRFCPPAFTFNFKSLGDVMAKNPVLDLPLVEVMRAEIALPLQHVLHLYTVGHFLKAWRNPRNHKSIEQVFDSPEQAHHAAGVCAAWLGIKVAIGNDPSVGWWWRDDSSSGTMTQA